MQRNSLSMGGDDLAGIMFELDDLLQENYLDPLPPMPNSSGEILAINANMSFLGATETPPNSSDEDSPSTASSLTSPARSSRGNPTSWMATKNIVASNPSAIVRHLPGYVAPNRVRTSMKDRIRMLRDEEEHLAQILQNARLRAQNSADAQPAAKNYNPSCNESCQPMWERIAMRQLKYREKAEHQSIHLRKLVEAQTRYLKSVRRAIRRRPNREDVSNAISAIALADQPGMLHELTCTRTFEKLISGLDAQFSRVDSIWKNLAIPDLSCPGRRCIAKDRTLREQLQIDFINRAQLPFNVNAAEQVMWAYLLDARLRQPCVVHSKVIDQCDSTIQASVSMTNNFNGLETSDSMSGVSRKLVESNRVIFVSLTVLEPELKNHAAAKGIKFFTTTVRVLKDGGALPDGTPSTIMESFWSTRAYDEDGASDCPSWKLEPFVRRGVGAMEAAIAREHMMIEDIFVQMSCQGRISR